MKSRTLLGCFAFLLLTLASARTVIAQNSLEREIQRLAFQLEDGSVFEKRDAAEALLRINPQDVSQDLRKEIARSFKELAFETHADDSAIEGLAVWGGKYSVPLLIELLERDRTRPPDGVWEAIAKYPTPESAEAVARKLGNFFSHEDAVRTLRKMGPVAEPALIQAAPSRESKVAIAAVQLLGDIGSEKSVPLLRKASSSRNVDVRDLAKASLKKIRDRAQNGTSPATTPSDSPFNETAATPSTRPTTPPASAEDSDDPGFGSDTPPTAGDDDGWGEALAEEDADRGDWSEINLLLPGEPEGSVSPDGASLAGSDWKAKPIRLTTKQGGSLSALYIGGDQNAPVGAVVYSSGPRGGVSRIELVDFKRAKSASNFVAPDGVKRCAISPNASRMLCTANADFHGGETRILLYDITKSDPLEKMSWTPYASERFNWTQAEIPCIEWVDNDRALTVNGSGQAVLWDLSGAKPKAVYQHDGVSGTRAALSPGRTYFALSTPRGVEVFRSSDGALLSRMEANSVPGTGSLAFDPEGKFLTLVSGKRIYHWDAATGNQLSDFYCEAFTGGGDHRWVGDDLILVGGDLVDLKQRRILWRYEGGGTVARAAAPYLWAAMQSQSVRGLMPFQIPHAAALAARGEESDPGQFVVQPGAAVTVENQVGDENREAIETGLQKAVEECGFKTSASEPVKLVVRLGEVKTEDSSYRRFGESLFSEGEKVTVETGRTYDVSLEIDGKPAWKSQVMQWSGGTPFHVQMKDGESIQQAVDRERESRKGKFNFTIQLPQYVVHPDKAGPVGTSQLTLAGIK